MKTVDAFKQRLSASPNDPNSQVLMNLLRGLCLEEKITITDLYKLPQEDFEIAMDMLKRWRLDQHTGNREQFTEMLFKPRKQ